MRILTFTTLFVLVAAMVGQAYAHPLHVTHHKGYGVNGSTSALAGNGGRHKSTRSGGPVGGRT